MDKATLLKRLPFNKMKEELQKERNHKLHIKKKEYLTILEAREIGDYSKVFETNFYIKHGGEYCSLLQVINRFCY